MGSGLRPVMEACPFGHRYTAENTRWVRGSRGGGRVRQCRVCGLWRTRKRRAERAGVPVPPRPGPDAGFEPGRERAQKEQERPVVTVEELFAQVVRVGACWVWTGAVWPSGVPRFEGGVAVRVAARAALGRALPADAGVEMLCGEVLCVNPHHARLSGRVGVVRGWCAGGHAVDVSARLLRAGDYLCDACRGTVVRVRKPV